MTRKISTEQDEEATMVVIYAEDKINTYNHDVKFASLKEAKQV